MNMTAAMLFPTKPFLSNASKQRAVKVPGWGHCETSPSFRLCMAVCEEDDDDDDKLWTEEHCLLVKSQAQ